MLPKTIGIKNLKIFLSSKVFKITSTPMPLGSPIEIPTLIVNNKCDAINSSNLKELKKKKKDEVFISAKNDENFKELRSQIYKQLFNGFYSGWVSMENDLAKTRSILFDMGCVQEERVSDCGKIFANIKISNKELDKFISLKGFELCCHEDILSA